MPQQPSKCSEGRSILVPALCQPLDHSSSTVREDGGPLPTAVGRFSEMLTEGLGHQSPFQLTT